MDELSGSGLTPRGQIPTVRKIAAAAASQWGVIGHEQLLRLGISAARIHRWLSSGWLHAIHRGVYALGNPSVQVEGLLVAALLHAGDGAALSHTTAAWWWQLLPHPPEVIEVISSSFVASTQGVKVRHPRHINATRHRRLVVTTVAQTLLDFASQAELQPLRSAIAEADYRGLLDLEAVKAVLGPGRRGSAALRKALAGYEPQYAWTRSRLERAFLDLCKRHGIPLPRTNIKIEGWPVDAVWPDQRIVVELDGYRNHRSRAQLERDHRRDLALRAAGYIVVRYTETQVIEDAAAVARDLVALLSFAAPPAARGSR